MLEEVGPPCEVMPVDLMDKASDPEVLAANPAGGSRCCATAQ